MTRLKLIPWLAIPALLFAFGLVLPTANAAAPAENDDVIYLPMGEQQEWLKQGTNSGLKTSAAGEVTTSQFGVADAVIGNTNGMLSVRFDPPFNAPYTITGISFPTRTQFQIPATPGRFISVRILGMNASGLPDKSNSYYEQRRVAVSSTGGMNTIPLNIAGAPGQTFFAVFHFPRPPASADTFPFLFTDRNFTDRGLFANSFTTDTNAVIRTAPATLGTFTGTALFSDQNFVVSMTCQLTGAAPMNAPGNAGLNLRDIQAEWTYGEPDQSVLADGTSSGNTHTNGVDLVKRDLTWGFVAQSGIQSGRIQLETVPGSGMQIWGIRGRATNGTTSEVSNVTISGPASVVGYPGTIAEDADEANGKDSDVESAAVTPPFVGRPETLWPAGDIDNYTFFAQPGQVISVTATPVGNDFRSDMSLVVNLMENNHDVVESQIGGPGAAVSFLSNAAPPSGSSGNKAFKRYYLQVYDRSGSPDDPANWNRVLIPASYTLDVDVFTPAANLIADDPELSGASPAGDEFAFANAGRNPSRGPATFSYVIPKSRGEASVRLRIYDVRGRMINTLVNGTKAAGTHFASWSGHDQRGNRVASGPYFARIDTGSFSRTVRIVMN